IHRGSLADFYNRAYAALEGSEAYLIAADGEMNQFMNTRVPYGTPLGQVADIESGRAALSSGEPIVSNAFQGNVSGRWVFNVLLPLPQESGRVRMLILTQDAERLSNSLSSQNLRGGWNAVLVDRRGVVLASSYMSSDIGKPFFLAGEREPTSSTVRSTVVFEGRNYETIRSTSSYSGWQTIVWAPSDVVHAPLVRSMQYLALGGLAI